MRLAVVVSQVQNQLIQNRKSKTSKRSSAGTLSACSDIMSSTSFSEDRSAKQQIKEGHFDNMFVYIHGTISQTFPSRPFTTSSIYTTSPWKSQLDLQKAFFRQSESVRNKRKWAQMLDFTLPHPSSQSGRVAESGMTKVFQIDSMFFFFSSDVFFSAAD